MDEISQHSSNVAGLRGANQIAMRAWNERLVLTLVRRHGALARAEIARMTGLSAQTASVIVRQLETDGLLSRGAPQRGRVGQPSLPMSLAPEGVFFLGLKIGRRTLELVATDLLGRIRARRSLRHAWPGVTGVVDFARSASAEVLAELGPDVAGRIAGLGIAMPFQLWEWAPLIGAPAAEMADWKIRDIRAELAAVFGFPVFVANDGSAACAAELMFGSAALPADFCYFYLGFFIGGGVVVNGSLFTGHNGNAGALGSMLVPDGSGGMVQLLDIASLAVLERRITAAGIEAEQLWQSPDWQVPPAILDPWIRASAAAIAHAIAGCAAVVGFQAAMIDGWLPPAVLKALVAETRAHLTGMRLTGIAPPLPIEGSVGPAARALGAASLPMTERFFVDMNAIQRIP